MVMFIQQFLFHFQPRAHEEQPQRLFQAPGVAMLQAETSPSAPQVTPAQVTLLILQLHPPKHKQH